MSNINIKRAVENIRANTTVYTPVIEMIVNAIQAIEDSEQANGKVSIRVLRSSQVELDDSLADVTGFEIEDNGIGFTDEHRKSFDTLYTDRRIAEGGKGFGRFICLKYFENFHVESVYEEESRFKSRSFDMGKEQDIIVNEKIVANEQKESGTVVSITSLKKAPAFEKKLSTIARNLVERLLPYFIIEGYTCPEIELSESNGNSIISLNGFINNNASDFIREIDIETNSFTLMARETEEKFLARVFKLYAPKKQKSRISLVAHKREVSGSMLHKYIPEFEEEFFDKNRDEETGQDRNYIIKVYVTGAYLDRNVSLERGGFEFAMDSELLLGISQAEIERNAAAIARDAVGSGITLRQEKKRNHVLSYVDNYAPWHKTIFSKINLSELPYNPTDEEIEACLQKEKFAQELAIKKDMTKLLSETNLENSKDTVVEIVQKISDNSKNDLVHYVAFRRNILDVFRKSLEMDDSGSYAPESAVHDIIFPRKSDTETVPFQNHNLWIMDERLNFTNYVSSDIPLGGKNRGRPDLLAYGKRVLFRGDNEASNPITIFEFKRPQRDDFSDPSSQEDPVQQIVRYVNRIRKGKCKTPEGREIRVTEYTPFYGFVVCDLTSKVLTWLELEKNFQPMPDRLGWFQWISNINLYIEVISWEKILEDAQKRNQIFFYKLGI